MKLQNLSIRVTTQSNLFIGGSPAAFEIGGVDLYTVTDYRGRPYIPASSFKGALRNIVREMAADKLGLEIQEAYKNYLTDLQADNMNRLEQMSLEPERNESVMERKESAMKRFEKELNRVSAECLFGIEGFNRSPKLIFNDLEAAEEKENIEDYFSIDSKNSIEQSGKNEEPKVAANPRTYKVIRPGVTFQGNILFFDFDKLALSPSKVTEFVLHAIEQFNTGMYRLGNSGSRGYGKVKIDVEVNQERG